ncbi:MAG TPA: hypothetical protein VF523_08755, partial [Burkholderiales bacterium]
MATIRILTDTDISAVAALFMRVNPEHGWTSEMACAEYFQEILFDNPWREPQLPSWVAVERGQIAACYAVLPRRMILKGRPIRVAVGCQFMVDSTKCDGRVWLQLAKACLSGPQDLTLADGANDASRRMWLAIGGTAPLLYALHWIRLLRPARYAISMLEQRGALPRALALPVRPIVALADALVARSRPNCFNRMDQDAVGHDLDADTMSAHFPEVVKGLASWPDYDARGLRWLLAQAARKTRHGKLRMRAVRDGGQTIGWYLYYTTPGRVGEVVQIAASDGCFDRVLRNLLADAWRQGATALRGRLHPRHVQTFSDQHCWLRRDGPWTLVHSRHADVV